MPNIAYSLIANTPTLEPDGNWWWTLRAHAVARHGPFCTESDALAHRERRFHTLQRRARAAGGWGWRSTHTRWHVVLPDGVPCDAPRMRRQPCSVHLPLPGEATPSASDGSEP